MSPRRAKAVRGRVGADPATALHDHLLDTVERLIAERGVTSITTRDIARAAEVSDGVLYNYFEDKTQLLLAAMVRRYAGMVGRFAAQLPEPGTGTVEENLTAFAAAAMDLLDEALPAAAGLLHEPELLHRFVAAIHTEPYGPHQVQGPILEYLRAEQRLGRLGPVPPEATFVLFFGATLVVALSGMMGGRDREESLRDLGLAIATLVRGLEPRAAPGDRP